MGEYAKRLSDGEDVKIGTCENMYYLRADQRHLVDYSDWNLDSDRFRFPFPDEDGTAPGEFGDHNRSYPIPNSWQLPEDFTGHGKVQFVAARAGYNCCLPCPEGPEALAEDVLRVHRNGWSGGPRIVQQAFREGDLATIVACGACGAKWRLSADAALDVAAALEAEANRTDWGPTEVDSEGRWTGPSSERLYHGESGRERILEIARRMLAGYTRERVTA